MALKDLLVYLDQPLEPPPLQAALILAQRLDAQLTALYLIAEPFLRGMVGRHLPAEVMREHLAHAEAEAEASLRRPARRPSDTASNSTLCARAARSTGCRPCWRGTPVTPISP